MPALRIVPLEGSTDQPVNPELESDIVPALAKVIAAPEEAWVKVAEEAVPLAPFELKVTVYTTLKTGVQEAFAVMLLKVAGFVVVLLKVPPPLQFQLAKT